VANTGCSFIFSKAQLTRFVEYHVLSLSMSACVLLAGDVADSCWRRHRMPDSAAVWHPAKNMRSRITFSTATSTGRNCRTAKYNRRSNPKLLVHHVVILLWILSHCL